MTSTTHWYDRGASGYDEPSDRDEDKNPGAREQWKEGREIARQQEKLTDLWTRSDDTNKNP